MSYNVDSVEELVLEASMAAVDIIEFLEADNLPESHFLEDLQKDAMDALKAGEPKRQIELVSFNWCHSGSGRSFEYLQEKIAPKIKGNIEAIFVWEGGDSVEGILVKDGKFARCNVIQTLEKPEGW